MSQDGSGRATVAVTAPVELGQESLLDPEATPFRWLTLRPAPPAPRDPQGVLERRLREPTAGPALAPRAPAVVVVPDATRATFVRPMVEAATAYLLEAGLHPDDVLLYVAGGMHRPPSAAELDLVLGEAAARFQVAIHDAADPGLADCGATRRGTPIALPRAVLDARTLVVIGGITPHYFAGWTGGLKGLVPGAAGRATATANHRLAVDPSSPGGLHPGCREGSLRANPVHADLAEAAGRAPAPFLINVVLGREGEPRTVVTGQAAAAHRAGVRLARRAVGVRLAPFPLAVVAAGAAGRERDWIQAHKVVRQGAACVEDGGTLIALAACPDGIGSATLLDWFAVGEARLAAAVAARYTLHGHTALAMRALTRRIRVVVVSRLASEVVRSMGMEPAASLGEALDLAAARLPRGAPALLLARAGTLLPTAVPSAVR